MCAVTTTDVASTRIDVVDVDGARIFLDVGGDVMTDVTRRTITEYRWFCTDKERCEAIDEQIDKLMYHASKLSSYVVNAEISGLECLMLEGKFKLAIKELRNERATLWRRVKRKIEEETEHEDVPQPLVNIGIVQRGETVRVD
jgi:hypothetical protein